MSRARDSVSAEGFGGCSVLVLAVVGSDFWIRVSCSCPNGLSKGLSAVARLSSGHGGAVEGGFLSLGRSIAIACGVGLVYQEWEGTSVCQVCTCPLPSLPALWVTWTNSQAAFGPRGADLGAQCSLSFLHMVGAVLRCLLSLSAFQPGVMPWPLRAPAGPGLGRPARSPSSP